MKRRVTKQHLRRPRVLLLIGLTVLLVAWLIWSSLFAQPTKRDYELALEQTKTLEQSQQRLEAASSGYVQAIVASLRLKLDGSNLTSDTKDAADTYRKELRSYESAADRLEGSRVGRDKEAAGALKQASDHSASLIRSVRSLTEYYDELYRAYVACDSVVRFKTAGAADAARYYSVTKPCLDELNTLSKVSMAELADYAKKASELINKKRQLYATNAAVSDLQAIDVQLMMLDPISRVQTLKQDLFATTKLDALQTLLERKRNAS